MSERPKGLHCPGCGKRAFRTYDSRACKGGQRRRRVCMACGFRVTTMETVIRSDQGAIPARLKVKAVAE